MSLIYKYLPIEALAKPTSNTTTTKRGHPETDGKGLSPNWRDALRRVRRCLARASIDRKSYLTDGLLRITQPTDLNDPFESYSFYDPYDPKIAVKNAFIEAKNDPASAAKILGKHPVSAFQSYAAYMKEADDTLGVLSFSKRWDSTTMWAHYASGHRGYCIGFDCNHPFFANARTAGNIRDVTYISEKLPCRLHEGEYPELKHFLFYKSVEWMYEQEIRLVCRLSDHDEKKTAPKDSISGCPVYLKKVPFPAVKEIMIGRNCENGLSKTIRSFAHTHQISVFEMRHFELCRPDFSMHRVALGQ